VYCLIVCRRLCSGINLPAPLKMEAACFLRKFLPNYTASYTIKH
jgi:hypothetical protein